MVSDVFFLSVSFPVQSAQVQLVSDTDPGLTYNLTLDDGTDLATAVIVVPGTRSLPGRAHIFFARAGEDSSALQPGGSAGRPASLSRPLLLTCLTGPPRKAWALSI